MQLANWLTDYIHRPSTQRKENVPPRFDGRFEPDAARNAQPEGYQKVDFSVRILQQTIATEVKPLPAPTGGAYRK